MAQLVLDVRGMSLQDRVGRKVDPARLQRASGDRPHETPHDLTEDQWRLGGRGVYADPQARYVDAFADHVDRDDPGIAGPREGRKLLRGACVRVEHDDGRLCGHVAQDLRDRARVLPIGGDDKATRVAVTALAQLVKSLMCLAEDPRQAIGQLDGDRRAIAPARLTAGQLVRERRLDDVIAAAPLKAPVVRDERHRPADAVSHGVGIRVRHVGLGYAVGVVANARNRALVGAERSAGQQQPAVADRTEGPFEARTPGELVAEVMGLVGDHERVARHAARPASSGLRDARIGDGDPVEVVRGPWVLGVGLKVQAERRRDARPLARQGRGRADRDDTANRSARELLASELESGPRLAGARGRRDQEGPRIPRAHRHERPLLPAPQR